MAIKRKDKHKEDKKTKKNEQEQVTAAESQPVSAYTAKTQEVLSTSAELRKEIALGFEKLRSETAQGKFIKKAQENQALLDRYSEEDEAAENENRSQLPAELNLLLISETGNAKLGSYLMAIKTLEALFRNTSTAESILHGANQLEPFVVGFLDNLYNAMECGYAMKASAANDLIMYVYKIGFRYIDTDDEEVRKKAIETRVKLLQTVGKDLIAAIDKLYGDINEYSLTEKQYAKAMEEEQRQFLQFESSCPKEVKDLIDTLGFKGAMNTFGIGDERTKYLDMVLNHHTKIASMLEYSMLLQAKMRDIIGIKNDIDTLVFELKRAYLSNDKVFNDEEHLRVLNEIHAKNLETMKNADLRTVERTKAEQTLMARLEEIQNSPPTGESVENAKRGINNYRYMQKQNEKLKEQEYRAKLDYEENKRRAEVEKERQRLIADQEHLNAMTAINEEYQDILNQEDMIEAQIENTPQTNPAETIENRQVITEEA